MDDPLDVDAMTLKKQISNISWNHDLVKSKSTKQDLVEEE